MVVLLTEVVGGCGRIGSQFMRLTENPIVVPYGVCPGSISSTPNHPIYVCTPATSWSTIYETTMPGRCSDLVFVGNGLLPKNIPYHDVTVVVPHFAVLHVGDRPSFTKTAPPTYIAGKHSHIVETLLQKDGIINIRQYLGQHH
jgi:hypothetical protein